MSPTLLKHCRLEYLLLWVWMAHLAAAVTSLAQMLVFSTRLSTEVEVGPVQLYQKFPILHPFKTRQDKTSGIRHLGMPIDVSNAYYHI
jgi:hypothetical protein